MNSVIRYTTIVLLMLIIGGLLGWYFFIKTQSTELETLSTGRGLGSAEPEGATETGSTYKNNATAAQEATQRFGDTITEPGVTFPGDAQDSLGTRAVDVPLSGSWATTTNANMVGGKRFKAPRLWHVENTPVAGYGFILYGTSTIKLGHVERATGYLFISDAQAASVTRITNTLTPKVYEAFVAKDGAVIERYLDPDGRIMTFSATGTKPSANNAPQPLVGSLLSGTISALAVQPGTRNIFAIEETATAYVGYTAAWDGTRKKPLFNSAVGSWKPFFLSDGRIIVTQKPEDGVPGNAYIVHSDGTLESIARNIPGLTILPLAGSETLLYGSSGGGVVSMFLRTKATSTKTLSIKTAADKCVWASPSTAYCAAPISPPEQ
ncbi:MAG: hypothetical protein RIQ56_798, partial [Candidatus Parcubacteria bacterium]